MSFSGEAKEENSRHFGVPINKRKRRRPFGAAWIAKLLLFSVTVAGFWGKVHGEKRSQLAIQRVSPQDAAPAAGRAESGPRPAAGGTAKGVGALGRRSVELWAANGTVWTTQIASPPPNPNQTRI